MVAAEASDLLEVVKALAALFEEILSRVNVCFLESLACLVRLRIIFLVLVVKLLTFQLGLVLIERLVFFLLVNQLIIEVLQTAEVSDDLPLVILLTRIIECVAIDFEDLKVVAEAREVPH